MIIFQNCHYLYLQQIDHKLRFKEKIQNHSDTTFVMAANEFVWKLVYMDHNANHIFWS